MICNPFTDFNSNSSNFFVLIFVINPYTNVFSIAICNKATAETRNTNLNVVERSKQYTRSIKKITQKPEKNIFNVTFRQLW